LLSVLTVFSTGRDYKVDGIVGEDIRYCVPMLMIADVGRQDRTRFPTLAMDIEYGTSDSDKFRHAYRLY
jgi:hypothetical protein